MLDVKKPALGWSEVLMEFTDFMQYKLIAVGVIAFLLGAFGYLK